MDEALKCEACGDDGPMFIHGRCHPASRLWAKVTGDVLEIQCATCEKTIVRYKVLAYA